MEAVTTLGWQGPEPLISTASSPSPSPFPTTTFIFSEFTSFFPYLYLISISLSPFLIISHVALLHCLSLFIPPPLHLTLQNNRTVQLLVQGEVFILAWFFLSKQELGKHAAFAWLAVNQLFTVLPTPAPNFWTCELISSKLVRKVKL